jgi:hypothetical protein
MITDEIVGLHGREAWAYFSDDMLYRYVLGRRWRDGPTCLFVMLNPSTADAFKLDPTVTRCRNFAVREGCGILEVVNLYAWRATDPRELAKIDDPIGEMNLVSIGSAAGRADLIIAAWGATPPGMSRGERGLLVSRILPALLAVAPVYVLGWTGKGDPRHPLYLRADAPLEQIHPAKP